LVAAVAETAVVHRSYHGLRGVHYTSPYHHTYTAGLYRHHLPLSYHTYSRHRREAEAEPQPEAEAGTYVYNTVPYAYNTHYTPYLAVDPATIKVKSTAPAPTFHYAPYYSPYAHHTYNYNPYPYSFYHPYVVKPVEENEAVEQTAATSDEDESETVEVSRKRREAEPEAEPEAATKVVTHHVTPLTYQVPYLYGAPRKVVKTYSTYPAYTYGYPHYAPYSAQYGYYYGRK